MKAKFGYLNSLLFVAAAVLGTMTIAASNSSQAWADVIEGTEGNDFIVGTPEADLIDSKGGEDANFGDTFEGDGSGDDIIVSGEGVDDNSGDTGIGDGSGDDIIASGEGDDFINRGDTGIGMVLGMT
jgi:hypothetical protein